MTNSSDSVTSSTGTPSSDRFTGRVKWFNNKAGYGFITVTDGPNSGSDIFTHHSSIKVDSEQYKYLVQGEYVEFMLSTTSNGVHEFQAGYVSGIKGGKLMCETRNDLRSSRTQYKSVKTTTEHEEPREVSPPKQRQPRARGQGPRESAAEEGKWTYVSKKNKNTESTKRTAKEPRPTNTKEVRQRST